MRYIYWVMLQLQTILQCFYKMLMWQISYWFLSRPTINITFFFTNKLTILAICKTFCKKIYISNIIHIYLIFMSKIDIEWIKRLLDFVTKVHTPHANDPCHYHEPPNIITWKSVMIKYDTHVSLIHGSYFKIKSHSYGA